MSNTIAAISTPIMTGAIGIIRISGDEAIKIAEKVFISASNKKIDDFKSRYMYFGSFIDSEKNIIDEGLIVIFKGPGSYTGEDMVEFYCHGGVLVLKEILNSLLKSGALMAKEGEFSKRAFLNGKMDLLKAEAVMDVISAKSKTALKLASKQLKGNLSKKISQIRGDLINSLANIMAVIDFPEEGLEDIDLKEIKINCEKQRDNIIKLIKSFSSSNAVKEGIPVAIAGSPNSGKSSLMNALYGEDKSIVTDIAGTTRDLVEGTVKFGKVILRLIDTAGIREIDDVVESIGVKKAYDAIENADLIFAVFDGSKRLSEDDKKLISYLKDKNTIGIINKNDLEFKIESEIIKNSFDYYCEISAKEKNDIDKLVSIVENLYIDSDSENEEWLTSLRQKELAEKSVKFINQFIQGIDDGLTLDMLSVDLDEACNALGEITGESLSEDIVENIFSRFCVGK